MATLPMVYSNPDELPIIGRFEERVDLTTARQPLYMYLSREEVMEEPIDLTAPVKKDSEYYKRRRQRRRQFKAQSLLLLEDSTPRGIRDPHRGLKVEGHLSNLNLNSESGLSNAPGGAYQAKPAARSVSEAPFKFVILQPQKVFVDGVESTQILVTPVGDWYGFRKPSVGGQKLLDEIDDEYDAKQVRDKAKLNRYRRLVTGAGAGLAEEEEGEGAGGRARRGSSKEEGEEGEEDMLPAVFGRAAAQAKGRRGGGKKKGGAAAGDDVDIAEGLVDIVAAPGEYGEWGGGDYAKQFADDEEEHVGAAQQLLEQGEARVAEHDLSAGGSLGEVRVDKDGRVVALAVDGTGDYLGDNDDDYDDEEGDWEGEDEEDDAVPRAMTGSGSGISEGGSGAGMVDLDMERGAREYGRMVAAQRQRQQMLQQSLADIDSGIMGSSVDHQQPLKSALSSQPSIQTSAGRKRDRVENDTTDAKDVAESKEMDVDNTQPASTSIKPPGAKQVSFGSAASMSPAKLTTNSQTLNPLSPSLPSPIAGKGSAVSPTKLDLATTPSAVPAPARLELTEASVRAYLASMGGRATVAALKESFKAKVSEYNKLHKAHAGGDDKPGAKLFKDILFRVTVPEDDAVLGKVLRLVPGR